jgi:hypothetical protein
MELISAAVFDALMEFAPRIAEDLDLGERRRLTPSRVLVLALLSVSSSREHIRTAARALKEESKYAQAIRRVHVRKRLVRILQDLHALGLLRKSTHRDGAHHYALEPDVRACMRSYLRRVWEPRRTPSARAA